MKKNEFEAAYRESEILRVCKQKIYIPSAGHFDFNLGRNNAIKLMKMDLTVAELSYVRPSDGFSLLHFSITSHNPYLVALFISLGANIDFAAKGGVTPRKLIEKTGHLVQGMPSAFYYHNEFLIDEGLASKREEGEKEEAGYSVGCEVVEEFSLIEISFSASEDSSDYLVTEGCKEKDGGTGVIGEFLEI